MKNKPSDLYVACLVVFIMGLIVFFTADFFVIFDVWIGLLLMIGSIIVAIIFFILYKKHNPK